MIEMVVWIVLACVTAGTYLLRIGGLLLVRDGQVPQWLDSPLALLGPAAVTALVVSIIVPSGGGDGASLAAIGAIGVGFVVARRTGNLLYSLAAGLPSMWVLSAIGL